MLFRRIVDYMHVLCIENIYIFHDYSVFVSFRVLCNATVYAMRPYMGHRTDGGFKPQTRGRLAQGQGRLFE